MFNNMAAVGVTVCLFLVTMVMKTLYNQGEHGLDDPIEKYGSLSFTVLHNIIHGVHSIYTV